MAHDNNFFNLRSNLLVSKPVEGENKKMKSKRAHTIIAFIFSLFSFHRRAPSRHQERNEIEGALETKSEASLSFIFYIKLHFLKKIKVIL